MKRLLVVLLAMCVAALSFGAATSRPVAAQETAVGQLINIAGIPLGLATLTEVPTGGVLVTLAAAGFDPVAGDHRLLLTDAGLCETSNFASTGDTVAVLPDAQIFASGTLDYERVVEDVTFDVLTDANGSALLLYADTGDNPGDLIACAVLTPLEAAQPTEEPPAAPTPPAPAPIEEEEPAAAGPTYYADLINISGIPLGAAAFVEEQGFLGAAIVASGFDPVASDHRVAITAVGECNPPKFASAGDDVAVLPNLFINSAGVVDYAVAPEGLTLADLSDASGSAVVIYAGHGDEPGERIACGVIVPAEPGTATP